MARRSTSAITPVEFARRGVEGDVEKYTMGVPGDNVFRACSRNSMAASCIATMTSNRCPLYFVARRLLKVC